VFSFLPIVGNITTGTGSQRSWDRAKEWLRDCQQDHSCSTKPPDQNNLPTRVLDLQAQNTTGVSLFETQHRTGVYACLSHRWGVSQPLKTTKANISQLQDEILETDLPRTFLDAIAVARHLSIRYLWIDSLCIVQDDDNDWKHEASLMAQIYRDSAITLVATISDGANSGLFRRRAIIANREISTLTGNPDHEGVFLAEQEQRNHHGIVGRPELMTRGWILQERLLSPRLLHFNHELVYECAQGCFCECTQARSSRIPKYLARKDTCEDLVLENLDIPQLYERWCFLVAQYSTMKLSFDSDVLPAISGLARVFHKYFGGNYIAGLWESILVHELSWRVVTPRSCMRRTPWVAPTFSWAALNISRPALEEFLEFDYIGVLPSKAVDNSETDWAVQWVRHRFYEEGGIENEEGTDKCEVIDARCTLAGSDPLGQITDAFLILKGLLYPTVVEGLNKVLSCCHSPLDGDFEGEYFWADFDYTVSNECQQGITLGTQLYCFVLQSYKSKNAEEWDWVCSLVLRKVGDHPGAEGIFERIGVLQYDRTPDGILERPERQGKTLIEELKERAGDGSGIVVDAIVKII
jgi:hypothetical protein